MKKLNIEVCFPQFEIDKLLTQAEEVKIERAKERRVENERNRNKHLRANRMYNISLLVLLVASVVIFIWTGWIFILVLSPAFFGASSYYRKSRYR